MLAKGVNPDLVMEKIDAHWENLKISSLAKKNKIKKYQLQGSSSEI